MEQFTSELQEQLQVATAFTIPVFGGIQVAESTVITWVIMAVLAALSIYLGSNLKVHNPGKRQQVAEMIVTFLDNFINGMLGEKGKQYGTLISVILIYIGVSNVIGLFGLKPPTKDLNVTVGLSLISIVLIEVAGIRAKGAKGWLKSFSQPVAMELIKMVVPVGVPAIFSLYFDIFDGLIQAYVFVFLTSLYIQDAVE